MKRKSVLNFFLDPAIKSMLRNFDATPGGRVASIHQKHDPLAAALFLSKLRRSRKETSLFARRLSAMVPDHSPQPAPTDRPGPEVILCFKL